MFIQLSEFNFAHGQPTCKALYCVVMVMQFKTLTMTLVLELDLHSDELPNSARGEGERGEC